MRERYSSTAPTAVVPLPPPIPISVTVPSPGLTPKLWHHFLSHMEPVVGNSTTVMSCNSSNMSGTTNRWWTVVNSEHSQCLRLSVSTSTAVFSVLVHHIHVQLNVPRYLQWNQWTWSPSAPLQQRHWVHFPPGLRMKLSVDPFRWCHSDLWPSQPAVLLSSCSKPRSNNSTWLLQLFHPVHTSCIHHVCLLHSFTPPTFSRSISSFPRTLSPKALPLLSRTRITRNRWKGTDAEHLTWHKLWDLMLSSRCLELWNPYLS